MITDTTNNWRSPVRRIGAKVEQYSSATLAAVYTANDALKNFSIERLGDTSKFFGYGICQKINIHLIDNKREKNITTADSFRAFISSGGNLINTAPEFTVTEVHRDENTNELSITAYDALYWATEHTFNELGLEAPYTITDVMDAIVVLMGFNTKVLSGIPRNEGWSARSYEEGANYEGTETIREVLDDIAEATQSIYYIDRNNNLVFKRLKLEGVPALTIGKEDYISLDSKTNRRLVAVVSATELGDNVGASLEEAGTTQYVRDNPFWELREDIAAIVDEALAVVGGLTINQFQCSWRGNYALEIADKIALVTKDDDTVTSYLLNDTITYDGGLSQSTGWSYEETEDSHSNPTSIGEALKLTYAKVDKVNQTVEIVAAETAQLKMDAENVKITIDTILENQEATKVTTTTGFTFNEEGLKVTRSNSEISTLITEDGMSITKEDEEVLVANNEGVKAEDLHATTYLIIGRNSRIEDYADNERTGCFWIGR